METDVAKARISGMTSEFMVAIVSSFVAVSTSGPSVRAKADPPCTSVRLGDASIRQPSSLSSAPGRVRNGSGASAATARAVASVVRRAARATLQGTSVQATRAAITADTVHRIVTKRAAEVGTEATPHPLRRSCATKLRALDVALDTIQRYLGHASVHTTI